MRLVNLLLGTNFLHELILIATSLDFPEDYDQF